MSEDDQADPKMGPTIAQKFADAKVAGVAGHLNSGVSIPASAVYNQAGIPMISGSATNPEADRAGLQERSSAWSAATTSRARRSRSTWPT